MDIKTAVELQVQEDRASFARQLQTVRVELIPRMSAATASYTTLNHLAINASRAAAELLVIAGRIEANERVLLTLSESDLDPTTGRTTFDAEARAARGEQ